jgi:hypothetical protein
MRNLITIPRDKNIAIGQPRMPETSVAVLVIGDPASQAAFLGKTS